MGALFNSRWILARCSDGGAPDGLRTRAIALTCDPVPHPHEARWSEIPKELADLEPKE
jgi:hypothetical protein